MNYTAEERETIVNFDDSDDKCLVYTCSRPIMTKLDKLCKKSPSSYKLVIQDENSRSYIMDKNLISFRTPKVISEANRKKLSDNAKKMAKKLHSK